MGNVVDKKKAFKTCTCYSMGGKPIPENLLCYSEGVQGVLSNAQDLKCKKKSVQDISPAFQAHQQDFIRVSKECAIDPDDPNTFKQGQKMAKVIDLVSRSKCILSKFKEA